MIAPEDEFLNAALRKALHRAADPFEPDGDGLEKIRRQLVESGSGRTARQLLEWRMRLAWLARVRLEPLADRARSAAAPVARMWSVYAAQPWARSLAARWARIAGLWPPAVAWVRARVPSVGSRAADGAPPRRRPPAHAIPATAAARRSVQMAWMRSAVAVAGAVVIVVAGVYALAQLRQTVIQITQFSGGQPVPSSSAAATPAAKRSHRSQPTASVSAAPTPTPTAKRHTHQRAVPLPSCLPAPPAPPTSQPSPSASPSTLPTPSISPTVTPSPTTSSASPGASATSGIALPGQAVTSSATPVPCSQPGPLVSASPSISG